MVFPVLLYYSFIAAVAIQCGYALYYLAGIFSLRRTGLPAGGGREPVSIVICAKNEAANLKKNLPAVLSQRYSNGEGKPLYEVIVVNDASTDGTEDVLKEMELQYDNLWDVVIREDEVRGLKGKKFALSKGTAYASHEWLLLTDADSMSSSELWLELMVSPLGQGKEIVAGYGGYKKTKGPLNAFIRWETLHTFLQYSTYAQAGIPYMAVGRNLACTKTIFNKAQGGTIWNTVNSGDDDLLITICATAQNTAIVADTKAFTYTDAKEGIKEWAAQKKRHFSTGKYYKRQVQFLLTLYACSHAAVWLCFFMLLFFEHGETVICLMAVRCLLYWLLWMIGARWVKENISILFYPLSDIGWLLYNFAFFPYITWKNKAHWK